MIMMRDECTTDDKACTDQGYTGDMRRNATQETVGVVDIMCTASYCGRWVVATEWHKSIGGSCSDYHYAKPWKGKKVTKTQIDDYGLCG